MKNKFRSIYKQLLFRRIGNDKHNEVKRFNENRWTRLEHNNWIPTATDLN